MSRTDSLYAMIPPRGSMLRAQAELAVHLRRLGRAIRSEPAVRSTVATLRRLPWWTFYVVSFAFMAWAFWYGDPGWMIAAVAYTAWGLWVRR